MCPPPAFLSPVPLPLLPFPPSDSTHRPPVTARLSARSLPAALPTVLSLIYFPTIFLLSPAHAPSAPPQVPLAEALDLSLNFNYILPLSLPSLAPHCNPVTESLFNICVAHATLLLGFAHDRPGHAENNAPSGAPNKLLSPTTAVILVPFLTNMLWLPYLSLRPLLPPPPPPPPPLSSLSQSRLLPLYAVATLLLSCVYFLLGRPGDIPPSLAPRLAELGALLHDNVLASSFAADILAFSILQGACVDDDVSLRSWTGPRMERARAAAKFIPFLGLAWYLYERADDAEKLG